MNYFPHLLLTSLLSITEIFARSLFLRFTLQKVLVGNMVVLLRYFLRFELC